jgi:choline dehydrogenase-like flavoprotein
MIPKAEASGNCEIRAESTVFNLIPGPDGRIKEVAYYDKDGVEHAQRAKSVILSANGAETPRLLLMSTSSQFPDGMANSSGVVGKYLMFNTQNPSYGLFEHQLNEFKGPQVTRIVHDYYDSDPARGFYGGGGLDARSQPGSPLWFALQGLPPETPRWGHDFKQTLSEYYTRTMTVACHTTSLPLESNSISLDPDYTDEFGRPAIRTTYMDHPDDLATQSFLVERSIEILEAAGAKRTWRTPVVPTTVGAHLLGTCRMGTDARKSVVDPSHRAHDVKNLFIVDGSSLVTSGRGQPTMTIQALAFRAADHIKEFARLGDI